MLVLLVFVLLIGAGWGFVSFGFVGASPFVAMLLILAALQGIAGLGHAR